MILFKTLTRKCFYHFSEDLYGNLYHHSLLILKWFEGTRQILKPFLIQNNSLLLSVFPIKVAKVFLLNLNAFENYRDFIKKRMILDL